jgi:hypothetical protein
MNDQLQAPCRFTPRYPLDMRLGGPIVDLDAVEKVLWRVEPLLCNDRKKGGCTRPDSGQRLDKHVPIARQQIIDSATVGL